MKAIDWNIPKDCEVDMRNPIRYIEVSGMLGTFGVATCWVTLLYAHSGIKRGILAHYAAEETYKHIAAISELLHTHPEMKDSQIKRAIILVDNTCRFTDKVFPMYETIYKRNMDDLQASVREGFDVDSHIIEYPYADTADELDEVILSLDDAAWSAWFGSGKFE